MADAKDLLTDEEMIAAVLETEEIFAHMEGDAPDGVVLRVLVSEEGEEFLAEEILSLDGIPDAEEMEALYGDLASSLKEHLTGEVIALILSVRGFTSVAEADDDEELPEDSDEAELNADPTWMVSAQTADGRTCGAFFLDKGEEGLELMADLEVLVTTRDDQDPLFQAFRLDMLLDMLRTK